MLLLHLLALLLATVVFCCQRQRCLHYCCRNGRHRDCDVCAVVPCLLKRCNDDHRLQHYEAMFFSSCLPSHMHLSEFPYVSLNVTNVAGRHCILGEARLMEASASVRLP